MGQVVYRLCLGYPKAPSRGTWQPTFGRSTQRATRATTTSSWRRPRAPSLQWMAWRPVGLEEKSWLMAHFQENNNLGCIHLRVVSTRPFEFIPIDMSLGLGPAAQLEVSITTPSGEVKTQECLAGADIVVQVGLAENSTQWPAGSYVVLAEQ